MTATDLDPALAAALPDAFDLAPVAVTVLDLDARIVQYNRYAESILDRRPEYLGRDVREFHNAPRSVAKIDQILAAYRRGEGGEFAWRLHRGGRVFAVRVAPLTLRDTIVGVLHAVMVLDEDTVPAHTG